MKYIVKYMFAVCALLFAAGAATAQTAVTTNGVGVSDIEMERSGGRLNVGMTLDMSNLKVRSNKSLRITPVVTDGNEMMQLPSVMIDGRRREIQHERMRDGELSSSTLYVRRYNRKPQTMQYDYNVNFEPWMRNSQLILREEWCSCHDEALSEEFVTVAELRQPAPRVNTTPRMAYATPPADASAARRQETAAIYFPVNKSEINPSFMDNTQGLDNLRKIFADGKGANSVRLMGYASPEGPYAFNEALAAKRAEAVKQYLNSNNLGSGVNVTTDSSPANWDAVKKLLSETCINDYRKIIAIIDDPSIKPADKNAEIRRRHPVEYNFMLTTWYPRLRVTDVTVDAPSRRPNVDEAKRMLRDDPSQLSLADIYMIALTYEKGSKEWNDIIILAVDTYPQSPEARVNAANVSMANGNYAKAAAYLQGVPSTMPEAMNSRGILAMSQGNYDEAMSLFRQAQQAGVSEAAYNISLLRELMQLGK